jgi:hypothetical protein
VIQVGSGSAAALWSGARADFLEMRGGDSASPGVGLISTQESGTVSLTVEVDHVYNSGAAVPASGRRISA